MKKLYLFLAVLIIFSGCGGNSGAAVTDADFFNRDIKGEITISVFDTMIYQSYLEEMARGFEAAYPGTRVKIEAFSAMPEIRTMTEETEEGSFMVSVVIPSDDSQSRADYISRVNTMFMSGQGANIYAMDIIPLHRFIQSGALENLDIYMNLDPAFNKSDYRQNIFDALRYLDGIWFMPADYFLAYYAYDSTLIPAHMTSDFGINKALTIEELFNLSIPLYDGNSRLYTGNIFNHLLRENYRSFVNLETGNANFVDGNFTALLDNIKDYTERGFLHRFISSQMDIDQIIQEQMEALSDKVFFKLNGHNSLLFYFMGIKGEEESIAGIRAITGGTVPFEYGLGFGINSQSKNKETAWAFIKFILSKEMQLSMNIYNLPINNEARSESADRILGSPYEMLNENERRSIDEYKAAVESFSDMINGILVRDSNLNDMISHEVEYFFNGVRSADEVARVLQNKADLYLSE